MFVIAFVANMIIRHPQCMKLIHKMKKHEDSNMTSKILTKDPYRENELDPMESKALLSSLWEVDLIMKSHYDESVRNYCKLFKSDMLKK